MNAGADANYNEGTEIWRRQMQGNRNETTTEVLLVYITEKVSKQVCKLPDEDNLHFL